MNYIYIGVLVCVYMHLSVQVCQVCANDCECKIWFLTKLGIGHLGRSLCSDAAPSIYSSHSLRKAKNCTLNPIESLPSPSNG